LKFETTRTQTTAERSKKKKKKKMVEEEEKNIIIVISTTKKETKGHYLVHDRYEQLSRGSVIKRGENLLKTISFEKKQMKLTSCPTYAHLFIEESIFMVSA